MQPEFFTKNVNLSKRNSTMTFINFTDKIMSSIYKLIFGTSLPTMIEEMKAYLQNSNETVGHWFLYKEFIILRVYGFENEPYRLLVFLTKRIFVLEFLKQRLHVESEIFLKHKKASNMKFKYTIDPFVVNSTVALTVVQSILKSMNFQVDKSFKYDPKHIISQRKLASRLGTYEHTKDEELAIKANHSYIGHDVEMSSNGQEEDKG